MIWLFGALPAVGQVRSSDPLIARVRALGAIQRHTSTLMLDGYDPRGWDTLFDALESGDPALRMGAMTVLLRTGLFDVEHAAQLTADLAHPDSDLRMFAALAAGNITDAAPQLVPALTRVVAADGNRNVRWAAVRSLSAFGSAAASADEVLCGVIAKDSGDLQIEAIAALKSIGGDPRRAIPVLTPVLEDPNEFARAVAASAILALSTDAERASHAAAVSSAENVLRRGTHGSSQVLRRFACAGLTSSPRLSVASIEALANALTDQRNSEALRKEVLAGLLKHAKAAAEVAVPALGRLAESQTAPKELRVQAMKALQSMAGDAQPAVSALARVAAADPDESVRTEAIRSAINIAPRAPALVARLPSMLESTNDSIVNYAAFALLLNEQGSLVRAKVPVLRRVLASQDPDRGYAAFLLGRLHAPKDEVVPPLIAALQDADGAVRRIAASALGAVGAESMIPTVEDFEKRLQGPNVESVARAAGQSVIFLQAIAEFIPDLSADNCLLASRLAAKVLKATPAVEGTFPQDPLFREQATSLNAYFAHRAAAQQPPLLARALDWSLEGPSHALASGGALYLLLGFGFWTLIVRVRPLWVFQATQALKPYKLDLPHNFLGLKIDASLLLLCGFFAYRPRVLDAWVAASLSTAREAFERKFTVQARRIHVSLPAVVDGETVSDFAGARLRGAFSKRRGCLLISGEGGSGKTSLACRIARLSMSDDPSERPVAHPMLPVLLEHDLPPAADGTDRLMAAIRGQLQALLGSEQVLPEELFVQLLKSRRLLVIVDHLSEMAESTRQCICPGRAEFPVSALVVTSRVEEVLENVPRVVVKPLRVEGSNLSSFMEAYLVHRGKRQLFNDADYFALCRQLSRLVGERNVTPLLATLYAEQAIAQRGRDSMTQAPENVPELMVSYLDTLNRDVKEERLDDRVIRRDAKLIAWASLKHAFQPTPVPHAAALESLGVSDAQDHLDYFEQRLRLLETVNRTQGSLRFSLDPLAEYLAALHLVDTHGSDALAWRAFLDHAEQLLKENKPIGGFLAAITDCCRTWKGHRAVPRFVVDALASSQGAEATKLLSHTAGLSISERPPDDSNAVH